MGPEDPCPLLFIFSSHIYQVILMCEFRPPEVQAVNVWRDCTSFS